MTATVILALSIFGQQELPYEVSNPRVDGDVVILDVMIKNNTGKVVKIKRPEYFRPDPNNPTGDSAAYTEIYTGTKENGADAETAEIFSDIHGLLLSESKMIQPGQSFRNQVKIKGLNFPIRDVVLNYRIAKTLDFGTSDLIHITTKESKLVAKLVTAAQARQEAAAAEAVRNQAFQAQEAKQAQIRDNAARAKAKADWEAEAAKAKVEAKAKAEANAVLQKKIDTRKIEIEDLRAKVAMLDKAHRASAKKSREADKSDDLVNMRKYKDQSMVEYAEWKATKSKLESLQEEVRKLALQVAYN